MNKVFLVLALFSCASVSMAAGVKVNTSLTHGAIGIEQKNQAIMSNYKTYFIASRKQDQLKQSLIEKQYADFLKNKRTL